MNPVWSSPLVLCVHMDDSGSSVYSNKYTLFSYGHELNYFHQKPTVQAKAAAEQVLLYLSLNAESSGVIHNAFAHPRDGLRGTVWSVTENCQGRGVQSCLANPVDTCRTED